MIENFIYDIRTRILFGFGQLARLREEKLPGKKALLVISAGKSMKAQGYLDRVEKELDAAGVGRVLFDKIKPNPTLDSVNEGAALAKKESCDFVVGLGGGSSMDAAKAIAFAMTNPGDLWDYCHSATGGKKAPVADAAPIVCITTTAGTGSEVDQWAVITKEATDEKSGFGYASMYPTLSVVDPDLMMTVPPRLTAFQGMDAFFHAAESMINTKNHVIGEMFALKAIELIARWLPAAVKNGGDREARYHMAVANTLAGYYMLCTSQHTIEHALSGYYHDLPHGAGLIMISRAYFGKFAELRACDGQMVKMAKAMGVNSPTGPEAFLEALDKLLRDSGVGDLKMSDYGITLEGLERIPQRTREVLGGDISADPAELSNADILEIMRKSFK